jgi:hypothetical protein
MKTNELSGAQLDWAVARAEGQEVEFEDGELCLPSSYYKDGDPYKPSEDWAQGGPIIQRERIRLDPRGVWVAGHDSSNDEYLGATPLIAAMRCYVASKLGEEVEIPEELK